MQAQMQMNNLDCNQYVFMDQLTGMVKRVAMQVTPSKSACLPAYATTTLHVGMHTKGMRLCRSHQYNTAAVTAQPCCLINIDAIDYGVLVLNCGYTSQFQNLYAGH